MSEQKAITFRDLIGIPFEYEKMDCEILVKEVFNRYGVRVSDDCMARQAITCYNFKNNAQAIEECLKDWIEIDKPKEPCLIAMSLGVPGFMHHIGVYIGEGRFIHTSSMRGAVTIERVDNPLYRNKKFYTYNGN